MRLRPIQSEEKATWCWPGRRSGRELTLGPIFSTLSLMRVPLVLAAGLVLFCACEDPVEGDPADSGVATDSGARVDSGPPRDTGIDGGQGDTLLADADPILDASPSDADPVDASPSDGGPRTGPLTIIFEPNSAFNTSGVAIFQDGAGTLRATRTTTVGMIVETIEEGWMVTITYNLTTPTYLFTITEVAPNETYRVPAYTNPPTLAVMAFAIGEPYPGADSYWFETGCFGQRLTNDPNDLSYVAITEECTSPAGLIDYTVVARAANLDRLAFKLLEDLPVVANATVTISGAWRTDFAAVDVSVSNAPTGVEYVGLEAAVNSNGAEYDYDRDNLVLSGGAGNFTLVRPPFGEGLNTRYEMISQDSESWLQMTARPPTDQVYDLSTDFLPFPGPVTLAPTPIVGRPTATWTGIPGLDLVDLQVLSFSQGIKWSVILRGDATTFLFPELPPELTSAQPTDLPSFITATRVIDADTVTDYTGTRAAIAPSVIHWPIQFDLRHQPLGAQVRGAGLRHDCK